MTVFDTTSVGEKSSLQQKLRQWIASELPHLSNISDETLQLLTQHTTTQRLFGFLTTRVRSAAHVRAIRATLQLTSFEHESGPNSKEQVEEGRTHDEIVEHLQDEIASAEQQLLALRSQLLKNGTSLDHHMSTDGFLNDGYDRVFSGRGGQSSSARLAAQEIFTNRLDSVSQAGSKSITLLHNYSQSSPKTSLSSPTKLASQGIRQSNAAGLLQSQVCALAADALDDALDDSDLRVHVDAIIEGASANAIAQLLRPAVREAARRRACFVDPPADVMALAESGTLDDISPTTNGREEVMDIARDYQLKAGSFWQTRLQDLKGASKRVEQHNDGGNGLLQSRSGRELFAYVEGERAALKLMTQTSLAADRAAVDRDTSDVNDITDLRKQKERAYITASARIDKLEKATTRIASSSMNALDESLLAARQDTVCASLLRDDVRHCVSAAHSAMDAVKRVIEETRQWDGHNNATKLTAEKVFPEAKESPRIRVKVANGWKKVWQHECKRLRMLADVVADNRTQTMLVVEQYLMEQLEVALEVETRRKETHAAFALHDLRLWDAEPGREALRQLAMGRVGKGSTKATQR